MRLDNALDASPQKRAINRSGSETPVVEVIQKDLFHPEEGWEIRATGYNGVMYNPHQFEWIEQFLNRPINTPKTDDLDPDAWEPA